MTAHQFFLGRRKTLALFVVEIREAGHRAGMHHVVFERQVFYDFPVLVGKLIVRGAHVGELRLAADARDRIREQHRIAVRRRQIRAVRVPAPAAQEIHAAPVAGGERLIVLVEVGDIRHHRREPMVGSRRMKRHHRLERSEVLTEGHQLRIVDHLPGENQYRVRAASLFDRIDLLVAQRLAQVQPANARCDGRMGGFDIQAHVQISLKCSPAR
jgi:hypothetical protein